MADEETTSISKGLNTLLKMTVHERLTRYAKENASDPFGKWSYNTAFEKLLDMADNDIKYGRLEERMNFLEYKLQELCASASKTEPVEEPKKEKSMFLGGS